MGLSSRLLGLGLVVSVMLMAGCVPGSRLAGEWANSTGATLKFTPGSDFIYTQGGTSKAGTYKLIDDNTLLMKASNISWANGVAGEELTVKIKWNGGSSFTLDESVETDTMFELVGGRAFSKVSGAAEPSQDLNAGRDQEEALTAIKEHVTSALAEGDGSTKVTGWHSASRDEFFDAAVSQANEVRDDPMQMNPAEAEKLRAGFAEYDRSPRTQNYYFRANMNARGTQYSNYYAVYRLAKDDPNLAFWAKEGKHVGDWVLFGFLLPSVKD
jgi:hypothetical protein